MGYFFNGLKRLLPHQIKHRIKRISSGLVARVRVRTKPIEPHQLRWKLLMEYELQVRRRTPIIIYQAGKVGSSSVYLSLRDMGFLVFHQHHISTEHLQSVLADENTSLLARRSAHRGIWLENRVIKRKHPVKIISLTRDPLARSVSGFFQNLDLRSGMKNAHERYSLDELQEKFVPHLLRTTENNWYDLEFKNTTGIDIYAYPFDPAVGYRRIQEGNCDILLLKLETPDEIKEQAIAEFLNLPEFKLTNANVGEEKAYADVYQEFKQQVHIPTDILDQNYNSKHVRHFYTEDEIARFRARWEPE